MTRPDPDAAQATVLDDETLLARSAAVSFEKHIHGVLPNAKTVVGEGGIQGQCTIRATADGATMTTTVHATIDDLTLVTDGRREVIPNEEYRAGHAKMLLHARAIKGMFDLRQFLVEKGAGYEFESPEEYLDHHAYLLGESHEEVRWHLADLASGNLNALVDIDEPLSGIRGQVYEIEADIEEIGKHTCSLCAVFGDGDPCGECDQD